MSLRNFHLFFIAVSVVLAAFMAAWAIGQYRADGSAAFMATGVASALSGVALAVYGAKFQRKTRNL
ncbi:MAG TPA: hypothetical protein VJP86_09195 [Vicinamibacterales bacterium]|jgi:hypothetical protein|nr:hypothetical protein [Vicinamibacterales bacterium]